MAIELRRWRRTSRADAEMHACKACGTPFDEATGGAPCICGQCLADQIEASLMLQLLGPRKPARRAGELRAPEVPESESERRTA